ncbi:MAG: TRAP transporter small permease [Pseudomonadota bacterium]
MRQFLNIYYRVLQVAMTAMLGLLLVPVTMQIVARYSDIIPRYIWTEEISRFAFVWIILLGSIIAIRDKTHFIVDVLPQLGPKGHRALTIITLAAMFIAGLIFTYGGYNFAKFGAIQRSELAGLPMLAIYIAWPILGVSWLLFTAEQIYDFATGSEEQTNGSL